MDEIFVEIFNVEGENLLSEKQLLQIKELQDVCESHDLIKLKLNWEMLRNRTCNEKEDLFYYDEDKLVGFLGKYYFGEKVEICGMVRPEYRRKGIFTTLINEGLESCKAASSILLNAPAASLTAQEFIKSQQCDYSFSEYQMVWKNKEARDFEPIIKLVKATPDDFDIIIRLDVECFGFEEKDAQKYNNRVLNDPNRKCFLIEANGEKVGKLSVQRENQESWIYGFAVLPKFQGLGYGKNTLLQIIDQEKKTGNEIHLEVALENKNAKKLYNDCGFEQYDTQDYYKYK